MTNDRTEAADTADLVDLLFTVMPMVAAVVCCLITCERACERGHVCAGVCARVCVCAREWRLRLRVWI